MPRISLIIPCFNEEARIDSLLQSILEQTYPLEDMEVIFADGMSTDKTRSLIDEFQHSHPELKIKVIDNPKRIIPAALNLAIRASTGELIVKVVNADKAPAKVKLQFAGAKKIAAPIAVTTLTGAPEDENTLGTPPKVTPQTTSLKRSSPRFEYAFPANSLTVLRVKLD